MKHTQVYFLLDELGVLYAANGPFTLGPNGPERTSPDADPQRRYYWCSAEYERHGADWRVNLANELAANVCRFTQHNG